MNRGTKSILFGAHQSILHPLLVAAAWWKLYGFPRDPRRWIAFVVHDLGYWGSPSMDGPEGERHVERGAGFMRRWVDRFKGSRWHDFCLYHSRFYAKRDGTPCSRLCVADKLSLVLTPWWVYLPMAFLAGEIKEHMALADARTKAGEPKCASMNVHSDDRRQWYANVQEYLRRWVEEHKDGKEDTWTPALRSRSKGTDGLSSDAPSGMKTFEVWYTKPEFTRDFFMGHDWLFRRMPEMIPATRDDLKKTHVRLATVRATDADEVFEWLQGENWSPNGEAQKLIRSLKLDHTSMSVGDMVVVIREIVMCEPDGWAKVGVTRRREERKHDAGRGCQESA